MKRLLYAITLWALLAASASAQMLDVRVFGSKGDSTGVGLGTDDYAAINKAVAAAANKTLYFAYTGNGYRIGSNLTIPANVAVVMENGVQLYPDAGKTITFSGLIGQSLTMVVNDRKEHVASGSTLNQFGSVEQIAGGSGPQTISRVAKYLAAQTGGGGSNQVMPLNVVVQQNAADTMTSMSGIEVDVNNNKSDDPLNPAANVSHYGMTLISGGSKKVGPCAICISASTPGTNDWRRGLYILPSSIASGGFAFEYSGNASGGNPFLVRDDGRTMIGTSLVGVGTANDYMLNVDGANVSGGTQGMISATSAAAFIPYAAWNRATAGDNGFMAFYTEGGGGTLRGSITYNRGGGLVAYNTTSDARLKIVNGDADGQLDRLMGIKVRDYTWRRSGTHVQAGFVAQELYPIAPEAVTRGDDGAKVERPWQVDNSKLVPMLVSAVQELKREVESLKAQLAANDFMYRVTAAK